MALAQVAQQAGVHTECIEIIARWEGCLKKVGPDLYGPYLCPAHVATIGIGTTVYPDGRKVRMGDKPVSRAGAEELLAFDIGRRYAPAVRRAFRGWQHANQESACISFAYNVGTGGFAKSTLCWLLKQGQYARAADEFMRWTRGGGRTLPGLVNRRRDERALFLRPTAKRPIGEAGAATPPVVERVPDVKPSVFQRIFWWWR